MDKHGFTVVCPQNEELAAFMWNKWQEMVDKPKGVTENLLMTLSKAYSSVCNSKSPIQSLKDLSQIKGVGKWILKQMQEFFGNGSGNSEPEDLTEKGKKTKGTKRYVPQKNSVAYALLITLYRGTANGTEFMRKHELIDAAEASGLSRVPIASEKGKGKPASFGSSPRDWYSGWTAMKTLINKGLVAKSSCPAKYMLTQEGQESAGECLLRSGLHDLTSTIDDTKGCSDVGTCNESDLNIVRSDSDVEVILPSTKVCRQKKSIDVPLESLERFMRMGFSKEQILFAFTEVSENCQNKEISSLWPSVLCRLREDQVYGLHSDSQTVKDDFCATSNFNTSKHGGQLELVGSESRLRHSSQSRDGGHMPRFCSSDKGQNSFTLRTCSTSGCSVLKSNRDGLEANMNILCMPPLSFGERFEDAYEVVLILDDREQFATQGSRSSRIIENIRSQFKIQIEVRRLPVGDGIWIARHEVLDSEYVLDFIVERKRVDDLRSSIRDSRYKDQKLRLLRCGLKKLIYLVEGDPNSSEASESIKTACFTTEILEGFDVHRTSGLADTLKKYGYLTQAITQYYRSQLSEDVSECSQACPSLDEFFKRCQDLNKMRISDVFAIQLMQVPQVTEDIAIAVLDLYPTLVSLAWAYSLLGGNLSAQEEMLKRQSNNVVNSVASRNIFQLVWGS